MLWMKAVKTCKSIHEKPIHFCIVTILENCTFCLAKSWNQSFFPLSLQIMVTWLRHGTRRDLIINWWVMLYNLSCNQSCSKRNPSYMLGIICCGGKMWWFIFKLAVPSDAFTKRLQKRIKSLTKYLQSMKNTFIGITTPDLTPER